MRTDRDRNWEALSYALAAESSGKAPRLFSSRKTLFGIPSALDQELQSLADEESRPAAHERTGDGAASQTTDPKTTPRSRKAEEPGKIGKAPASATRVTHPLEPVFDERSRVLVLGTMPSPKSRETGFYYNHPQNRFWKVMAALFDEPLPRTNEEKRALALSHGIALWDVLAECTIAGAADGTIAECVPNDIGRVLAQAPIEAVFCTGAKATELYRRYCEDRTQMGCVRLPSTSPANAAASLDDLIAAYRQILPWCEARETTKAEPTS